MTVRSTGSRFYLLWAAVLSVCLFALPAAAEREGYNIVEIPDLSQDQVQQVADRGIDILQVDGTNVIAHVSPADRDALRAAGFSFDVLVEDVQAYAEQKTAEWGISALEYHSYATLNPDLYALEASGVAKVYNIGSSLEGRDILAVRISDNPDVDEGEPAVLLVGCHHAREWISVEVPFYIAQHLVDNYATDPDVQSLVDNGEIWVVPLLNPDGHQYTVDTYRLWRKNRRNNGDGTYGVDLNRNYETGWGGSGSSGWSSSETYHGTAPFSEPETQVLRDFFLDPTYDFMAMISFHSYSQLIMYPWGHEYTKAPDHYKMDLIAKDMQDLVAAVHGANYTAQKGSALYLASGTTDDWTYDVSGIPSYTIELRPISVIPGFQLPPTQIQPTAEENIPAALYLIGLTQNDLDGDGVVEVEDNCMGAYNPGQEDVDEDSVGPPCDCDDTDPNVSPGEDEQCSNGVDDDCDNLIDGDDPDCSSSGWAAAKSAEASLKSGMSTSGLGFLNVLFMLTPPAVVVAFLRLRRKRG